MMSLASPPREQPTPRARNSSRSVYTVTPSSISNKTTSNRSSIRNLFSHRPRRNPCPVESSTTSLSSPSHAAHVKLESQYTSSLNDASSLLVDRLFSYLSVRNPSISSPSGFTLPASAIGWISHRLSLLDSSAEDEYLELNNIPNISMRMRDRLTLLKWLLPRVTHLRVTNDQWPPEPQRGEKETVKKKKKKKSKRPDFVCVDDSASALSSYSTQSWTSASHASSMDESVPNNVSLWAAPDHIAGGSKILNFWRELKYFPDVNLGIFPNLSVLVMDGINPEWLKGMEDIGRNLTLLRLERGCIYDLADFFVPFQLESSLEASASYPLLTHLKLSQCGLGELSNFTSAPPVLSRMKSLVSLSLANNEILHAKTVLTGIKELTRLDVLDLSHNRIRTMHRCNLMLGNIKTLVMTGNSLTSCKGIDKLYSLESLSLDFNRLQNLSHVAGLANLPNLTELRLNGNPMETNNPKHRVQVFNLFQDARGIPLEMARTKGSSPFPLLDGKSPTEEELTAIRSLTYATLDRSDGVIVSESVDLDWDSTLVVVAAPGDGGKEGQTVTPSVVKVSTGRYQKIKKDPTILRKRSIRRYRDTLSSQKPSDERDLRTIENIHDISFSVKDVFSSLVRSRAVLLVEDDDAGSGDNARSGDVAILTIDVGSEESSVYSSERPSVSFENEISHVLVSPPLDIQGSITDGVENSSWSPLFSDDVSVTDHDIDIEIAENENIGSNQINYQQESPLCATTNQDDSHKMEGALGISWVHDTGETNESPQDPHAFTQTEQSHTTDDHPEQNQEQQITPLGQDDDSAYSISESLLDFDVNNSLFSSKVNTDSQTIHDVDYTILENRATYDGDPNYSKRLISNNLKLYFREYVFPNDTHDNSFLEDSQHSSGPCFPRIQLCEFDRTLQQTDDHGILLHKQDDIFSSSAEKFIELWREDLLPCSDAGSLRWKPKVVPLTSFHGKVIQTLDGVDLTSNEARNATLCLSDLAFYIIPEDQGKYDKNRSFPSPLPKDAPFQTACWPHACARHPLQYLHKIMIGFGFQRLILSFKCPSPTGEEIQFTYILFTCNKKRTVSILQKIQSAADDVKSSRIGTRYEGTGQNSVLIENEDKSFLDALSAALDQTPTSTTAAAEGVIDISHYQILQQTWKTGNKSTVRRVCVLSDDQLFLLDENYMSGSGRVLFRKVDSADWGQVSEVKAAGKDPNSITIVIKSKGLLKRPHNWRLICKDRDGAEKLVDDIRKFMVVSRS